MKKTLALALVAAMAISMASMTAFAKVEYNGGASEAKMETATATVTITKEEYDEYFADSATEVSFKDLGDSAPEVQTTWNTAVKTQTGWSKAGGNGTTDADKIAKDDFKASDDGKTYTATLKANWKEATTEDEIAANLKALDEAKKDADTAKDNNDKLQKLDEKYGANTKDDATNGFVSKTGKATDITTTATRKQKEADGKTGMEDFYTHAISVAGAPDSDGDKTWVFDVKKTDGTSFGEGNTARVEFDLGFTDADLSKFDWKVYHIEGWCKAEKVKNVEIVGNKLYVWTDKFSPFVVTRGDINASAGADASNPSTGDFSAVPVALLAAAALGATGFVAYKKRKAE